MAAAACAYAASKTSGDELAGAYRESGHGLLATAATHDLPGSARAAPRPAALARELNGLRREHDGVAWAAVYDARGRTVAQTAAAPPGTGAAARAATARGATVEREVQSGDVHLALLARPLPGPPKGQTLVLGFDLTPSDAALAERNRRVLAVLIGLLTAFTLFTAIVLDRGIFRPLERMRAATNALRLGDLGTRLRWRRQDELGQLAHDFDEMASTLESSQTRLEALALTDPLTGLANHREFQEALVRGIDQAQADGQSLALVLVDVDQFKRVNDARGHPAGDRVLHAVGQRLSAAMAGLGVTARLGGDEFAVLLPGVDGAQAVALAEAARAAIAAASPTDWAITCSAGVAVYPEDARKAQDLIQVADGALYWAKTSGRDRCRRYDPEHVLVVTDEQRAEFADVLERPRAVRSVYQPIVSLRTGQTVGYEALARFDDSRNLPPSWWFAQAHRFGLGPQLEAEAIRVALSDDTRPAGTFLSVNLSPSAIGSDVVAAVLPENLLGIVIEVTEQERVHEPESLQAALDPLRARGARVAVDDAGGGYAGLQQVMRMGADIIKLDRALVQDIHTDRAKAALVRSLQHFASDTGAQLCAEGIESADELRTLVDIGVELGQGFLLARPGPPWSQVPDHVSRICREGPRTAADDPQVTVLADARDRRHLRP